MSHILMRRILKRMFYVVYSAVCPIWRSLERLASWREVRFWIDHVPGGVFRGVSFDGYTQWIHHQGLFSGLFAVLLKGEDLRILDLGCGMGKLAPVSLPFVRKGGGYLGIDTHRASIEWCRRTYADLPSCEFYLTRDKNAFYRNRHDVVTRTGEVDWPVGNESQDVVVAHSVLTHMQEAEAIVYVRKTHESLKPGGLAVISFHVVRDHVNANEFLNFRHPLTPGWFTGDPRCPEHAIGVELGAVERLIQGRFRILHWLEGNSTGGAGPSFQDIFVLQKI